MTDPTTTSLGAVSDSPERRRVVAANRQRIQARKLGPAPGDTDVERVGRFCLAVFLPLALTAQRALFAEVMVRARSRR
jgi:hypothetical protein